MPVCAMGLSSVGKDAYLWYVWPRMLQNNYEKCISGQCLWLSIRLWIYKVMIKLYSSQTLLIKITHTLLILVIGTTMLSIQILLIMKSCALTTTIIGRHLEIYQGLSEGLKKQSMEKMLQPGNIALRIQRKMWPLSTFILILLLMTSLPK